MGNEIHGVRGEPISDDQLLTLREKGGNALIDIDGRAFYSPGFGIASNGAAYRITRLGDMVRTMLDETRDKLTGNKLPWFKWARLRETSDCPVRLGIRFDGSMLYAHEKSRRLDLFRSPPLA